MINVEDSKWKDYPAYTHTPVYTSFFYDTNTFNPIHF